MHLKQRQSISILLIIFMFTAALSGCQGSSGQALDEHFGQAKLAVADQFAPYQEIEVKVKPQLKPYHVEKDLSNIENQNRFAISPSAQERLAENSFVVLPQTHSEFFMLYEFNRYDSVPNLITTDAMLHNYHLFFEHLLKSCEENQLYHELEQLNEAMLLSSQRQYNSLKNTPWENAARRNLAFFTVGSSLLDPSTRIAPEVQKEVQDELSLIKAHNETTVSPLMAIGKTPDPLESLKEDYTQYIPRSHYTHSEKLESYFKNMMWYGRMTFRLKDEDETRSAILMTLALQNWPAQENWDKIYTTTAFFVGESDDPGYREYAHLLEQVYGQEGTLNILINDEAKWQELLAKAKDLSGPSINSIPIFDATIQPDREQEVQGFRLMGQRYTIDADIFQRLIYREVGENQSGERRLLPKGLDIPAAMGSTEAYRILEASGETGYANYAKNMANLQKYIAEQQPSVWHQNLYWNWMKTLKPLITEKPAGYPSFMRNKAWIRKELNTFLASWTELKHDTILYAKQNYAEMGGGSDDEIDDRGYVEPNPHCYASLAALAALTRDGLENRGLIEERDIENLNRMETLALKLKDISIKELQNQPLDEEEYELIRSFGGQLEHFWMEALRDQAQEGGRSYLLTNYPAMLVADVATAPPALVLEEGNGYIHTIYAVVPIDGTLRLAKGGVYSHYEFTWPASDRLTDEKWREMLAQGEAPPAAEWTKIYTVEGDCRTITPITPRENAQK